jgi:serine/threonine protein kinase
MPLPEGELRLLSAAGYDLEGELGRGTSGVVYLARQPALDRLVAVKRVSLAGISETTRRRADAEVAALVRLESSGVVRLMDAIRTEGAVILLMEYVDGPTLRQLLRGRTEPLPIPCALAIVESLAGTLAHVASAGIVHRDVKPENVFLTREGRVKLGDFGVARDVLPSDPLGRLTRPGSIVGTPQYLSPEQAEGGEAGPPADVYGLGVVTYELFTGRVPFAYEGNLLALLAAQATVDPPDPCGLRPELPAALGAANLAALEKDPARRPESAAAFWDRLEAAARESWPQWRGEADLSALVGSYARVTPRPVPLGTIEEYDGNTVEAQPAVGVAGLPAPAPAPAPAPTEPAPPEPLVVSLARLPATGVATTEVPNRSGAPSLLRRPRPGLIVWGLLVLIFLAAVAAAFLIARAV